MRTTLNVDDDILEIAKEVAQARKISVGEALSELARRGLETPLGLRRDPVSGLMVFDVPPNARPISSEQVYEALENEDIEKHLELMEYLKKKNSDSPDQ